MPSNYIKYKLLPLLSMFEYVELSFFTLKYKELYPQGQTSCAQHVWPGKFPKRTEYLWHQFHDGNSMKAQRMLMVELSGHQYHISLHKVFH